LAGTRTGALLPALAPKGAQEQGTVLCVGMEERGGRLEVAGAKDGGGGGYEAGREEQAEGEAGPGNCSGDELGFWIDAG